VNNLKVNSLSIVGAVAMLVGLASAGYYVYTLPERQLQTAAEAAVSDWSRLNPRVNFQEVKAKVLTEDQEPSQIAILMYIQDYDYSWVLREAVVEGYKVAGEWQLTPIEEMFDPFNAQLLNVAEGTDWQCVEFLQKPTLNNEFPCVRLTYTGNFDWAWGSIWFSWENDQAATSSNHNCSCDWIKLSKGSTVDFHLRGDHPKWSEIETRELKFLVAEGLGQFEDNRHLKVGAFRFY
jgi:hypothetical protein